MGPAWPTRCKQCGKKVGVPYSSLLYAIPLFIALIYFNFAGMNLISIISLIVTFIFYFVMHMKFVPLISKE